MKKWGWFVQYGVTIALALGLGFSVKSGAALS